MFNKSQSKENIFDKYSMLSTSLIRIKLEGNAWEEIRGTKVKEKIKGI